MRKDIPPIENSHLYSAISPRFSLAKDVFLPKISQTHIDEALAKIKYHKTIYKDWGFASVDPCGSGIILNFYGKPGTGKTLTAEALAGTLGLNWISLGMSDVESKFMGETAKNIRAAFESASAQDAVLFFDEADTLLGKRLSNVTQGIDNEVNSLRSTLLMELERFEGIVIFATNFVENYDKAFESRITHHVKFELPDLEGRERLWAKHLPAQIPILENRDELIQKSATASDGLAGRDIRTCMRLALPKAILEVDGRVLDAKLSWSHLDAAIQQVKQAHKEVGSEVNPHQKSQALAAMKLLGANKTSSENKEEGTGI